MSTPIDDIWADPIEQSPSRTARAQAQKSSPRRQNEEDSDDNMFARPSKRSRSKLFLESSDEENEEIPPTSKPVTQGNSEIDHLFDDLDDEPTSAAPRSSRRDTEPIAPSSPSRIPITSSSPPRDGFSSALDRDKDVPAAKRYVPKLDEERLLSKDGFPVLVKMCKEFKPKGKGNELSDLNRLFSIYQFWTHKLYPKMTFHDNVNRVEKLCHSKRMHAALSGWKDEWHGTINGRKFPQEDIDMRSDDGDAEDEEEHRKRIADDVFGPATSSPSSRAASEGPTAHPPPSDSEGDGGETPMATDDEDPFDIDIDALLVEEEEEMMKQSGPWTTSENGAGPAKFKKPAETMDDFEFPDDEEALWNELHGGDDLDVTTGQPQKPPQPANGSNSSPGGGGEDMWDVLAELEKEQQSNTQNVLITREQDGPSTPTKKKSVASSDDDWDDMYVTGD